MKNQAGFTLVEVMVASVVAGIVMWGTLGAVRIAASWGGKLSRQQTASAILLADLKKFRAKQVRIVKLPLGECAELGGGFWARNVGQRTVELFVDASCRRSAGTLDALKNETYFHEPTNELWICTGQSSSLKLVIVKYLGGN